MKTTPFAIPQNHVNVFSFSVAAVLLLLLLPRPLTLFGVPLVVNFLHFPVVFALYVIILFFPGRPYDQFFPRLALLFVVIGMSALLNGAGVINVILEFLLLSEPFLILALLTNSSWAESSTNRITRVIFYVMLLHLFISYTQFLFFATNPDDVKGLFIDMGAGPHVAGAVALTAALYFFVESPPQAIFTRIVVPFFLATIVVIADAKQVILVYGISLGLIAFLGAEYLVAFKITRAFRLIKFAVLPAIAILLILPFAITPETAERFMTDIFVGLENKLSVFPIMWSFNESLLNAVFGLGPGHTIGRLAEMLPKYWDTLVGLGGTSAILLILPFAITPETAERFMTDIFVGLENKLSVFPIMWSFNESLLNAVFGLGPGHTIGRLAEMLPKYWDTLVGLGGTRRPVTSFIIFADYSNRLSSTSTGSSLFSLRFSWAGIWGDLGLAGIAAYLALWAFVWKRICRDLLSKFFVCNVLVFGTVFSWLEEPGYMGFVAILIGLRWQTMGRGRIEERAISTDRNFHGHPHSPDEVRSY